jgi:hypothetical protein
MPERLGLGFIPGTGWRASEVQDIARAAEDAGFEAAFCTEVNNGGRLIPGRGVSHQPVNKALGIDMPDPAAALRRYAVEVASWLRGDGPATHLPQRPSLYPVPIYLAALTSQNVGGDRSTQRSAGITFEANNSRCVCAHRGGSPGGNVHE